MPVYLFGEVFLEREMVEGGVGLGDASEDMGQLEGDSGGVLNIVGLKRG